MISVSVYMPTKDRCASLRRAVDSVLGQTHGELELIVVDDGSTDGTADYLAGLQAADARVRFIRHERPQGACVARNAAILAASGHFVTGLDDDDAFLPHRIACFVAYWQLLTSVGERPSCLYANDIYVDGRGGRVVSRKPGSIDAQLLYTGNVIGNQVFAPKSHFIEAGLFDPEMPAWQDLEFFMRMLKALGPGRLLDMPTYLFDVADRPDRISKRSRERLDEAYRLMCQKHGSTPRQRQQLYLHLFTAFYGRRATPSELLKFARGGLWLKGYKQLLQSAFGIYPL